MNTDQFRVYGKEMVDYMCEYMEGVGERRVTPTVQPGYLHQLLPQEAPDQPESWKSIMEDFDTKIMPGIVHWQHPQFHAYFNNSNSYPSILGDMLSDIISSFGFSWSSNPASTELEAIVLDWLGRAIGLPDSFLASSEGGKGGGVIQSSASECVLVSMLAARNRAIMELKKLHPSAEDAVLLSKLVAYCSEDAHSCVEKAAMICFVKLRSLKSDENCSLRGPELQKAMEEDQLSGLVPFFVTCTLGTTSCCSFDNLFEIGEVCRQFPLAWLHVDSAYAGSSFICPELKPLLSGIEYADSFNVSPNKLLLTCFDSSVLWVRDSISLTSALVVDPLYLQHSNSGHTIDYRHWGIALSRRFRSLKLWFVMRTYGISGLQSYIRKIMHLAKRFEALVREDCRFEVCNQVKVGLVCFRLCGSDDLNRTLLRHINATGRLHIMPASVKNQYVIRYCISTPNTTDLDIDESWRIITECASELLVILNLEKKETDSREC